MQVTVIISRSQTDPGREPIEDSLARMCSESGLSVLVVPHLYHVPENDPIWDTLSSLTGHVVLMTWLYPRPAEWLFRKHWDGDHLTVLNLADYPTAEEAFRCIGTSVPIQALGFGTEVQLRALDFGTEVPKHPRSRPSLPLLNTKHSTLNPSLRWYPIVDRSRCSNCRSCLQFCLFGVYDTNESGAVTVTKPDSCKHGCPACSRVCPSGAIMFPLYGQSAAIAGAPGLYMSPDAAARRMFYARTKLTCPVCGSTQESRIETPGAEICAECGRPMAGPSAERAGSELRDEIDQLIDDLDGLIQRG